MHILFVEDEPSFKIDHVIEYLKLKNIELSYVIHKSYHGACRYILEHLSEIDLAVVDLGLPLFDDGSHYDKLEGLNVVNFLMQKTLNIPVIINSTTKIPDEQEYIEDYASEGAKIIHVESLNFEWFEQYLKNLK